MAGLLDDVPREVVTSQAPRSNLSGAQIAQPYQELAGALDKAGEGLNDIATTLAEKQGAKDAQAITRDAQGNIVVAPPPTIFGPAGLAYTRALKMGALAQLDGDAKRADLALRQQFRDDPGAYDAQGNPTGGYLAAAEAYRKKSVDDVSGKLGPAVGNALGQAIEGTTTQTYRGLLNEKERLDLQRADNQIAAGITSAKDDAMNLARQGIGMDNPDMQKAVGKYATLLDERLHNPRLAYTQAQRDLDLQTFQSELVGNKFLNHIDQTYKQGGFQAAENDAKDILTNPGYKLSDQAREGFYHRAIGEVRANEAIRRQDAGEARAAFIELSMASASGMKIESDQVEQVAKAFRAAGDPAGEAKVYSQFSRKPLNDDFGRQPLRDQTSQLNDLRGAAGGDVGEARAYLNANSLHQNRVGDTSYLHPEFAVRLANAFKEAKAAGLNVGMVSGYRGPNETGSAYDAEGLSLHTYGAAADMSGIGTASSPEAQKWAAIATKNGLYNPYGVDNAKEFNHWQLIPDKLENRPDLIKSISAAGNDQAKIWQAIDGSIPARSLNSPVAGGGATPAGAAWLTANRQGELDSELWYGWKTIMKDYTEKGIRPNNDEVGKLLDGGRATGNSAFLEQVSHDMGRIDIATTEATRPLGEQNAAITQMTAAGQAGNLSPGQAAVLKDIEGRYKAITEGLKDDPIKTAVINFPDKLKTPAPLDFGHPDNLVAGLAARARIAQTAAQNWGTGPLPALDKQDIVQLKSALANPDPNVKAGLYGALATLPEDVRGATLRKLGGNEPAAMAEAAAGSMMATRPDIAASIFRGQAAMKADKRYDPEDEGEKKVDYLAALDKNLPAGVFALPDRTDPAGAYATTATMVKARYADLSAQAGSTAYSESRITQAVNDVTGGILHHNGAPLIAPQRGMSQTDFDGVMRGITDNDLAGVLTMGGQRITADYLRSKGTLESAGDGRYFVKLGSNPLAPLYAYKAPGAPPQGDGQWRKFVLDLRGRVSTPDAGPGQSSGATGPM